MKTCLDVINGYAGAFRDLVNSRIRCDKRSIRELLRLAKDGDWEFLCTSMNIVGDANEAIRNFLRFGLDGPTHYEDLGEKYLRLYGMLTAAYIQQQTATEIYRIMNVGSLKDLKKRFVALSIRTLRHKLASHSTDFVEHMKGNKKAYVPIRISLKGYECEYRGTDKHERVDLKKALEEHARLVINVLDEIYEKSTNTLYEGQKKELARHAERLDELRIERDGGIVLKMRAGRKVIVTLGTTRGQHSRNPSK